MLGTILSTNKKCIFHSRISKSDLATGYVVPRDSVLQAKYAVGRGWVRGSPGGLACTCAQGLHVVWDELSRWWARQGVAEGQRSWRDPEVSVPEVLYFLKTQPIFHSTPSLPPQICPEAHRGCCQGFSPARTNRACVTTEAST